MLTSPDMWKKQTKFSGGPAPIQMQRLARSKENRNSPQPILQEIDR